LLDDADVSRVLAVAAHPDDVDFAAAGTVAGWSAAGVEVTYAVITDGGAGTGTGHNREQLKEMRRNEQVRSAMATGVTDVRFLGYADGDLTVTLSLRRDLCRVIRQVRPQRMLIHSPDRNWRRVKTSHPDHLAAGEATIRAVYPDAGNPYAHVSLLANEGLSPWIVSEVWLMGSPAPTHIVDITDLLDLKLAAVSAHATQTAEMGNLRELLQVRGRRAARDARLPEGRLGEDFAVVSIA